MEGHEKVGQSFREDKRGVSIQVKSRSIFRTSTGRKDRELRISLKKQKKEKEDSKMTTT